MTDESDTSRQLPGRAGFHLSENKISLAEEEIRLKVEDLNVFYGDLRAVKNVDLLIRTNKVTSIIGPSGCGKSTFIRCLNRMHEVTPGGRVQGKVLARRSRPLRRRASIRSTCAGGSEWFFRSRMSFPACRSTTMSPPVID